MDILGAARLSTKGQITIPAHIRSLLGIAPGDSVTFIRGDDGAVGLMPETLLALRQAQAALMDAASAHKVRDCSALNRLIRTHSYRKHTHP